MGKIIFKKKSKFQEIELFQEQEKYWLNLNKQIQFHKDEHIISHNLQCDVPMQKFRPRKILILGGGDCLAATHVLKYHFVEKVKMVEIDKEMINMVNESKLMQKITKNVTKDPRLDIKIGDAKEFLINNEEVYDLIIEDIEHSYTKQSNTHSFEKYFNKLLSQDSAISMTDYDSNSINLKIFMRQNIESMVKHKKPTFSVYSDSPRKLFSEKYQNINLERLNERQIYICGNNYPKPFGFECYMIIS